VSTSDLEAVTAMTSQLRFGVSLRHARAEFQNKVTDLKLAAKVDAIVLTCRRSGASAIEPLQALVQQLHEQLREAEQIAAESATPKATVRLVIWLPVVAFGLAQLLGLPVLQVISQSVVAKVSVVFGIALLCLGGWLSSKMLKCQTEARHSRRSTGSHRAQSQLWAFISPSRAGCRSK